MKDSFLTIEKFSSSELKINKSKFIPQAFPLDSKPEISDLIKNVRKKYFNASHHPYAYRLVPDKNNFKVSDDGEPSGSSGKPILDTIDKFDLTNILVIVTRYFGGIKLGVGGLRRAYFEAAELCLRNTTIIEKFITEKIKLEFDYKFMNGIMNLIESEKIKLIENKSDEKCRLLVEVRLSKIKKVRRELDEITNGSMKVV